MAYVSGQHGSLFLGTDEIAKVRDWTVNLQHQPLDTTTLGDLDRTKTHGLRSYTGSGTLLYYQEETDSNLSQILSNTFSAGTGEPTDKNYGTTANEPERVTLDLRVNDKKIVLNAYITGVTVTVGTGEVVQSNFTFEGHGAPTTIDF